MNCNNCNNKIQILYNNKHDEIKIFHCKDCRTAYIFSSNKFKEEIPEDICLKLILTDPFYLNFINHENFNHLATKYIKI